ncbi:hypothetical protein NDU88_006322 [Pleurodeles waltl]|uniref:Uncharacterized protein n=1 Tax=Pleurodeles waltl TaxID=8319 RepID=A0AAV7PL36_PLEWA|nr:hypothetical protein NDU88_006322 [Pleurodeles waltl]
MSTGKGHCRINCVGYIRPKRAHEGRREYELGKQDIGVNDSLVGHRDMLKVKSVPGHMIGLYGYMIASRRTYDGSAWVAHDSMLCLDFMSVRNLMMILQKNNNHKVYKQKAVPRWSTDAVSFASAPVTVVKALTKPYQLQWVVGCSK